MVKRQAVLIAVVSLLTFLWTPQAQVFAHHPGNEGCTPGFWKNHLGAWVGYTPGQTVESVFNVPDAFGLDNDTLQTALSYPGGDGLAGAARILLRAAVAAILNAANPNVDYPQSAAQIISSVNSALTSSRGTMLALAAQLDTWNNLGAPPFCD